MELTKFVSRIDFADTRVDRSGGIIHDVSLVALGEARGHNKIADQRTLEQVRDCAKQYPNGLRVKFNPNTFNHGDAGLAGFIPSDTIQISDNKVIGDLHVYDSYPNKDYLYEIAERAPDNFGLSIEFSGMPEQIDGVNFARCDEIFAATLVDLPAANPTGLFAAGDLTTVKLSNKTKSNQGDDMTDEQVKTLAEQIVTGLKPTFEKFRMQQDAPAEGEPTQDEMDAAGCTDDMTDEEKSSKVNEYRRKPDAPLTEKTFRKGMFEMFRFTGGKAAKSSGAPTGDEIKIGAGDGKFETLVTTFRQRNPDVNVAAATLEVRNKHKEAYHDYCKRGRPDIPEVKGK